MPLEIPGPGEPQSASLPLPPPGLMDRVGRTEAPEPAARYLEIGAAMKEAVRRSLPEEWAWAGRRALDFGCGAGRVLRHFAAEAVEGDFVGCDIDREAVAFVQRRLSPPFGAFVVDEAPGLPRPAETFDVAWAFSVFTHLTDHWAGWLAELHRVLRPGGYLMVSFLGAAMAERLLGEAWDEDEVGMNVVAAGRSWDEGGPFVFHSEWWLRAHYGRAFDIVRIEPSVDRHGLAVMRKRPVAVTVEDLVRPEENEPRELAALRHNLAQLHAEDARVRAHVRRLGDRLERLENAPLRRGAREIRARGRRLLRRPDAPPRGKLPG